MVRRKRPLAGIDEDSRDHIARERAWVWAEQVLQDLRHAVRTLRRQPGFAAVVILTLAVAIGLNTAIFSVYNAVVLRPLGYPHPDRLVWLSTVGMDGESGFVTGPDFVEWRDRAASFERMVAYSNADYTLVSAHGATRVRQAMVTADFWDLSGATWRRAACLVGQTATRSSSCLRASPGAGSVAMST